MCTCACTNTQCKTTAAHQQNTPYSIQVSLPILGQQPSVHVATSFAVRPNDGASIADPATQQQSSASIADPATQQHSEGLQLPSAVPGSGALHLVAGLGHLPSVIASFELVALSAVRCVQASVFLLPDMCKFGVLCAHVSFTSST